MTQSVVMFFASLLKLHSDLNYTLTLSFVRSFAAHIYMQALL